MNLPDLHNWMAGEHALVVAPGPSSLEVPAERYTGHWTIGCNRALPYCDPDFAVCIEPKGNPCWRVIKAHAPLVTFTHLSSERAPIQRTVRASSDVAEWLPCSGGKLFLGMSPFYAAAAAIFLGFERVGIIGVDLARTHYPDPKFMADCETEWGRLVDLATSHGCELVNLNPKSRLQAVPTAGWETMRRRGCDA